MRLRTFLSGVLLLGVLLVTPIFSWAQEQDLAAVLPENTMMYVGWSGADVCMELSQSTPWGQIINDPQTQRLRDVLHGQWSEFVRAKMVENGNGDLYEPFQTILGSVWRYPTALAVLDVNMGEQGLDVQVALIVRAKDQSAALLNQIENLIQTRLNVAPVEVELETGQKCKQLMIIPMFPPIVWGGIGDFVVVATGQHTFAKMASAISGGPHLTDNPDFASARRTMEIDPRQLGMFLYVDFAKAIERTTKIMTAFGAMPPSNQPDRPDIVHEVLDAAGLGNLKTVAVATQARNGGYQTRVMLQTDGAPLGLLKIIGSAPVTDDDLIFVPKDASWMTAMNFDYRALYDTCLSVARPLVRAHRFSDNPETAAPEDVDRQIQSFIDQMNETLGFRLKEDLVDALGDTVVMFDAPSQGGFLITGWTKIVEVKDAARVQAALKSMVGFLSTQMDKPEHLTLKSYAYQGHEIYYVNVIGIPIPIAPAWTVHENHLITAFYPQMVTSVLDRLMKKDPMSSILANEDFVRGRRQLPDGACGLCYTDTRNSISGLYSILLPISQMMLAMGQKEGLGIDVSMLPSQNVVTRSLFGDVAGVYLRPDGILVNRDGPLPWAVPNLGSGGMAASAITVSVLLPSLARARELAKRSADAANLKMIGFSCQAYANDHENQLPPDLQIVVQNGVLSEKNLHSRRDATGEVSYVYVANQTINDDPENVLAYDRPDLSREGANVLFLDGHVEWMKPANFQKALDDTIQRLGERYKGPQPITTDGMNDRILFRH